jgi:hypothetical protein
VLLGLVPAAGAAAPASPSPSPSPHPRPRPRFALRPAGRCPRCTLRDLGPRLGVPVFETFCSEVEVAIWGPLGSQNRRHVRSSRHILIERKAKSNMGGLHLLLITMYVCGLTPLPLLCFCSSFSTNCCSLLLCEEGREQRRRQAHACISLRFAQRLFRVDQREAPLLNTLSICLDLHRQIELCFLTQSSSFWSSALSRRLCPREARRGVPGPLKTAPCSHRQCLGPRPGG